MIMSEMTKKIITFFFVFLGMTLYASLIWYLDSYTGVLICVYTLFPILLYLRRYDNIRLYLFLTCIICFIDSWFHYSAYRSLEDEISPLIQALPNYPPLFDPYGLIHGTISPGFALLIPFIQATPIFVIYGLIIAIKRHSKKEKIDKKIYVVLRTFCIIWAILLFFVFVSFYFDV